MSDDQNNIGTDQIHCRWIDKPSGSRKLGETAAALLAALIFALIGCGILGTPAQAQAVSWSEVDIGYPPTGGTFSYNGSATPPTYTMAGSGGGFEGTTTDIFGSATVATTGNIEIEAQLSSQSSTNTGAVAGLMMRESPARGAATAAITVTKGGALAFVYRTKMNEWSTSVSGPTVSMPVYLRLVRSGTTITGYYSTDDETWTSVGSYTQTNIMPSKYYVGFMSASTDSTLNSAVFNYVTYATSVPQQSANLLLWLRSDVGVTSAAGAVSSWADQSGNGLNATQSTGANKPSLVTGAINNSVLPTLTFNGSSQYLSMGADFASFNNGASIFVVLKPTNGTSTGDPCAFGNAANSDAVFPQIVNTQAKLFVYNGATASSVVTTTNPISTSAYQLLEETVLPGATTSTGTIYVNGTQSIQSTTLKLPSNISRTNNLIGAGIGPASYFNGGIAEVLVFNTALSASQRASVESYILSKFGVGTQPTLDAPTFSPGGGIFTPSQTVSIAQDQGAIPYFTVNGGTPTTSSQWFNTTPISVSGNSTIQSVGVAPFFNNSSTASSTYVIDPNTLAVPRSGLVLWLRGDTMVSTSGTNVTSWGDASGSFNSATQGTSANQPTLVSNAVNGLPAVSFTGSKFLQIPSGMANFTSGASLFVVMNPSSVTAGQRILDFGNGATSDNLQLQEPTSTGAAFYTYNGATGLNVTSSSAITLNSFQLLEAILNGTTGSVYTNSVLGNSGTLNALNNLVRANNYIGQGSGGGNSYHGKIAELMLFNRSVTASEQAAIEGYLLNRYQLLSVNSTPAPIFSVAAGTLTAPTQVAIEAPAAAQIFVTTDGTTPTTSSNSYVAPLNIYFTQTVKAIAVINGVSSSVTSAAYTLNATQWPAPGSTTTPLQLDLQLPAPSIPQDSNQH